MARRPIEGEAQEPKYIFDCRSQGDGHLTMDFDY